MEQVKTLLIRDWLRSSVASTLVLFWTACAAMVALGYALRLVAPVPSDVGDGSSQLLPNTVGVFPEPQDAFLFVGLALACLAVLMAVFVLAAGSRRFIANAQPVFWSLVAAAIAVLVIERGFPSVRLLGVSIGACLAATLLAFLVSRERLSTLARLCTWMLVPGAALLILVQRVWTTDSLVYTGPFSSHYEAVTSSVVRIASGSTCLADVLPQYGCYGEFLAPLLQLFGSDVVVVSSVFAVLLIAALWAALAFCAAVIRQPALMLGCALCMVMVTGFNLRYSNVDPVIQYYPLRFLFPSLSLLMVLWFQNDPGLGKSSALGVFAGCALAWNLESGVAVAVSLAGFVTIGNFTARPWTTRSGLATAFQRLLVFCFGLTALVGVFIGYLVLKSNGPVDLTNLIVFQQVFALTGFGMIPIPAFPAYWSMHAAVILGTLFLAAVAAARTSATRDPGLELAAFLAVLAIGLSVYFVGRSHILVLRLVMWPSIILVFFLLDRTFSAARPGLARSAAIAAIVVAIAVPAGFLISAVPSIAGVAMRVRAASQDLNKAVRDDIDFIRSKTLPGEPVGIVSVNQGVLYGHTATRAALEGPGVAEMIRRVDLERLMDFLITRGPQKLFIGTDLDRAAEEGKLGTNIEIDFDGLAAVYSAEDAPGGRLIYMERR